MKSSLVKDSSPVKDIVVDQVDEKYSEHMSERSNEELVPPHYYAQIGLQKKLMLALKSTIDSLAMAKR